MRMARRSYLVFVSTLASLTIALLGNNPLATASPQPIVAAFSAWDHGFDGPAAIPAGQTTIRLHNSGREPHQLQLLRLDEGKSSDDLAAYLQEHGWALPTWAKYMGGPNGEGSGGDAEATIYLEPGSDVLICLLPARNQQPHAALGMQKALRVTEQAPSIPDFHASFHMAMLDYEFVIVQNLRRGQHTFYVINRGSQPHQVSLVRLDPNASAEDVLAAFGPIVAPSCRDK